MWRVSNYLYLVGLWNAFRTEHLQNVFAPFVCLHDCIFTTCFHNKPDIIIIIIIYHANHHHEYQHARVVIKDCKL